MENKLVLKQKDLSQIINSVLTPEQLQKILGATPKNYIKKRPAKGGGEWLYTPVGYTIKKLNVMFGWNWDFEVVKEEVFIDSGEVIVKGRLTVKSGDVAIVKEQYGNKDIIFRKDSKRPLSIGNDIKSAASDALKKCASLLGIAADIYSKDTFNAVDVQLDRDRDIAYELSNCKSASELTAIWNSLSETQQQDYLNLFKLIEKTVK